MTSWDLDTSINVFRVVFTLVDKKTTSWDLDIIINVFRIVFTLVD